jgi:phosphate uptake regulator
MIMQNPSLSRKMEVSAGMAMYYHLISRIIERIGDHAVRIAENAQPIIDIDLDPKILAALKKAHLLSMNVFDKSIVSFFNADIMEAHKTIESVFALENICGEISNMAFLQETISAISISYIAESIRRAGEYSTDISENVINYIVEEDRTLRRRPSGK